MHHNVDYTKLPPAEAEAKAWDDFCDWMSPKQLKAARELARTSDEGTFAFGCSIAGVQGYPVAVAYSRLRAQS